MPELTRCPPATLERRFHAAVLDVGVLALPGAALAYVAHRLGAGPPGVLGVGVVALLASAVLEALALGATGSSPGRAALRLRTVGADGVPVGAARALLRAALLAGLAVATLGTALATLAWTALVDPSGRRRGWHDRLLDTLVLDVRGAGTPAPAAAPAPAGLVNLTALRLLPTPAAIPTPSVTVPTPSPVPPAASGAARWRVSFDTGESLVVEGLTLVGSDPEAASDEQVRHRVVLGPGDGSVSRTHAQLQVVAGGTLVVMDRGSAQGTVLLRGAAPRPLAPGRPTTLLAHDRVRFGERLMEVAREA